MIYKLGKASRLWPSSLLRGKFYNAKRLSAPLISEFISFEDILKAFKTAILNVHIKF